MTIIYCRNDPVSGRWSGVNRLLTEFEVDDNFYQHETRITTLEDNAHTTVSIDTITMPTPDTILFTMTDATTRGPFTIPSEAFADRGTWATSTAYAVNDTFHINGTVYRVLFAHTSSATSFDAAANDGAGHNYYSAMLSLPGNSLPSGGATGTSLKKSSTSDYAVTWGYPLPNGGTTGQGLIKSSNTDQDFAWGSLSVTGTSITYSPLPGSVIPSATNVTTALDALDALAGGYATTFLQVTNNLSELSGSLPTVRSNLGLPYAAASDFWGNISGSVVVTQTVWNAAAIVTLTDATTITIDMSTFINATVTLAGNRTLGAPSNAKAGQAGFISIIQDGTGSRTLAFGSGWKFAGGVAPTLSTAASSRDVLFYSVISPSIIIGSLVPGVS